MGSRVMHLIIANRIANELKLEERASFLIGGVAADAAAEKDLSHFYKGESKDYSRSIEYQNFIHKYDADKDSCFIQGYYAHLIADDLWLKGFYLPWLKNRMETEPDVFDRYHNDFRLLNGKLLHYYGFTQQLTEDLSKNAEIVTIEEVTPAAIQSFLPYVEGDLDYDKEECEQPLTVFTLEQIIGYIETSVDKGVMCIKEITS